MFQKFRDISDNDLVFEYKKTHHDDLEIEIISRYQKYAKRLAGLLFSKFKFLYQVEYDDIYCILANAIPLAVNGFKNHDADFYQYWKMVGTNEVLLYVSRFSQDMNELIDSNISYSDERKLTGYLKEKTEELKDDYLSSFALDDIFANPKNKLSNTDKDIFKLYLSGYSLLEVSELTGISYSKLRYRFNRAKRKIVNILFNQ